MRCFSPHKSSSVLVGCRPHPRALKILSIVGPGVALRSTPGFMLPAAPQVSEHNRSTWCGPLLLSTQMDQPALQGRGGGLRSVGYP
jgi:hypothetical protein